MPTVQPPCKVLVTGASGFIAMWVVQHLLTRGYLVKGTVRSADKGEYLKKSFAQYGDKFEVVVVEDMIKEGAFDDAVRGVDAVAHTASPVHFDAKHPEELIKPAVNGTVGILQSVLKHGPSVKRVVVTSSIAAILRESPIPITFTENDWNFESLKLVKELGDDAPQLAKYRASKTLAEQSAWTFMKEHSEINWDLVALNPPLVFGPAIHDVAHPASLNTSAKMFYDHVADADKAEAAGNEFLAKTGACWVDVRDLAEAHVLALEKQEAGGERIIISSGVWKWQDFIDAANAVEPAPKLSKRLPKGNPGAGSGNRETVHMVVCDAGKADRILGLKYRTIAETTRDTLASYEAHGW